MNSGGYSFSKSILNHKKIYAHKQTNPKTKKCILSYLHDFAPNLQLICPEEHHFCFYIHTRSVYKILGQLVCYHKFRLEHHAIFTNIQIDCLGNVLCPTHRQGRIKKYWDYCHGNVTWHCLILLTVREWMSKRRMQFLKGTEDIKSK